MNLKLLHLPPLVALATLLPAASPRSAADPAARPNVLLIMSDDQGYGDLSAHGNPVLKTPALDRLRRESVRFTDFHVASMCTPTRGQLLTGVDALRNGAFNVSSGRAILRRDFPTLPELLRPAGYRSGLFGKWHLGDNYPYRPEDRGFEETVWFPSSHISSAADFFNNDYFDDTYMRNGRRERVTGYCTDVFFAEAMAWMRRQGAAGRPFFCYLPLNAPHAPLLVPDRYREPYRNQKPAIASFFGMIANLDENIDRLERFLAETGLRDNTIVVFLTDNGTATGEPVFNAGMRGKKVTLYEGGHRVPLFVRWPAGLRQTGDVAGLAQVQDLVPTLLELTGVPAPARVRFDGTSLAATLRDPAVPLADRILVSQYTRIDSPAPKRGEAVVLWRRWRLVNDSELYDLERDPAQARNVIAEFPDVVARLRGHYASWWAGVAPRLGEFCPIHLGAPAAGTVLLTPCDWRDVFLDQQAQVRTMQRNGDWTVRVERGGEYEFELRRWPVEADAPIAAGMPAHPRETGRTPEGRAWPVASAEVAVAGQTRRAPVTPEHKAVRFVLTLPAGDAILHTTFRDAQQAELGGAYFVYVRRHDAAAAP